MYITERERKTGRQRQGGRKTRVLEKGEKKIKREIDNLYINSLF